MAFADKLKVKFGIRKIFLGLWIFLSYNLAPCLIEGNPNGRILTIPQGRLRGRYSETRDGRLFLDYYGLPFAEPPKRFRTARWPAPSWEGVRDATKRYPPCFQMRGQHSIGQEDCLTLNVHTPVTHENYWALKDLPVLVVFHGGAWMSDRGDFIGGSGDQFQAKYMMDEKCVLVTVNYRLGVFGFFTIYGLDGPANLGLKDQSMALRWVKEYIVHFGGNSSLVTIVGQGAGAASVGLHLLSPMSKGLFHRAIMQSGSPLCHWALVDDRQILGLQAFLTQLGCEPVADTSAVECVESKTPEELEQARQKIMTTFDDPFHPFRPVVEHWVRSRPKMKVFLPDYPINILSKGLDNATWKGIPIIMGVNSQDGLTFVTGQYLYNPGYKEEYFTNYTKSYPSNFGYGLSTERFANEEELNGVTEKIREFYYENIPAEEMKIERNHKIHVDMYSHRNYFQCVKNAAALYAKQTDVYLYYWSRMGSSFKTWHDYDKLNLPKGVAHGDEVHFLFDPSDDYGDFMLIRESRPKNLKFSKNVVRIWIQFAMTGKPIEDWTSMKSRDKNNLQWYELGEERKMTKETFTRFTDFLDSLKMDEARELPPPGEVKKLIQIKKEKEKDKDKGEEGQKSDESGEEEDEEEEAKQEVDGFIYMDLHSSEIK